jgi:hypothetical protein
MMPGRWSFIASDFVSDSAGMKSRIVGNLLASRMRALDGRWEGEVVKFHFDLAKFPA